tara:strand:- start:261 stop:371 length:111 start_codon:yes stop_codon:yes gene_type:complete
VSPAFAEGTKAEKRSVSARAAAPNFIDDFILGGRSA